MRKKKKPPSGVESETARAILEGEMRPSTIPSGPSVAEDYPHKYTPDELAVLHGDKPEDFWAMSGISYKPRKKGRSDTFGVLMSIIPLEEHCPNCGLKLGFNAASSLECFGCHRQLLDKAQKR